MQLLRRLFVVSISLIGISSLGADIVNESEPPGKVLASEFDAALAKRGIAAKFQSHCELVTKLFGDSRGTKTFSDKTGNCRLRWVEKLVTEPTAAMDEADRFTSELLAKVNGTDGLQEALKMIASKLDVDENALATLPLERKQPLDRMAAIVKTARAALDEAFAPLSIDERAELRAQLYDQTTGKSKLGHRFAEAEPGRRVANLCEKLDRRELLTAAAALSAATDPELLASFAKLEADDVGTHETPHGKIVVGGAESSTYRLDELEDGCVVIDLGGDDTYIEGTTTERRPILVVIDLAGNDTYEGERPGIQGAAILGAALLVDMAGNDRYTAKDIAQGSALAGIGMLVDHNGNDTYLGDRRIQGQAVAGCGILIDREGDDDYRGALLAQGVGGPLGFGLLADLRGKDHYFAGGKYPGGYDDTPGFGGWSQGVGIGPRGVANGGIGVLLDGAGDDVYEADYFSHGGGYWFAAGIARDFEGNDQRVGAARENFDSSERTEPRFVRWGTGYGCHYAAGFVFDDAGNDTYTADFAAIAYAWDIAIGAICDLSGDDRYVSQGSGVAQAYNSALAILYDRTGDDEYQGGLAATTDETPYHPDGGSGNFTLLFDGTGKDRYSPDIANEMTHERGWAGAILIDR
jgi:hypothetical protein